MITDPQPINSTTMSVKKMAQSTSDIRHMTHDIWHVTHRELKTLCQNTRSLALTVCKWLKSGMWHLTCDTWYMTHDTRHVPLDTQGVMNFVLKFQVPIFNVLGVRKFWRYFHKDHWLTDFINNKGVCRRAPATPGLLKIRKLFLI